MSRHLAALLLSLLAATAADAANRYLLPIPIGAPVDGAYGSRWGGELWAHNGSAGEVTIYTSASLCNIACPSGGEIRVGASRSASVTSAQPTVLLLSTAAVGGDVDLVRFGARVYDESRASTDWGTEIPIVGESDFQSGGVTLLNIPLEPGFRQTLRIYEWEGGGPSTVSVRAFDLATSALIAEADVTLTPLLGYSPFDLGYLQADLPALLPSLPAQPRVRIEVVPRTSGIRIWAFVSVTHNETQRVTLIQPQQD